MSKDKQPSKRKRRSRVKVSARQASQGLTADEPMDTASVLSEQSQRVGIAHYYVSALGCPGKASWHGEGGSISAILKVFNMPRGSRGKIKKVLVQVHRCLALGTLYDSDCFAQRGHRGRVIDSESLEAQLIADCLEQGAHILFPWQNTHLGYSTSINAHETLGISRTDARHIINSHRASVGVEPVSLSAVRSAASIMAPAVLLSTRSPRATPTPTPSGPRHVSPGAHS